MSEQPSSRVYWNSQLMSMVVELQAEGARKKLLISAEALDANYRSSDEQSYRDIFDQHREEIISAAQAQWS